MARRQWAPLFWTALILAGATDAKSQDAETTYYDDVKPILDRACAICHRPGAVDPDLNSFPFRTRIPMTQIQLVERLLLRAQGNPPRMPPPPRAGLNQAEIAVVREWLRQGLPE